MAHDPPGEAGPWTVDAIRRPHGPDRIPVDALADDGEDRRQQRQRREDREPDDDRPRDPDRAQDHELEQDEPEEPQQDGQAAEEHRPAGRGDRHPHRVGDALGAGRPFGQLFAEPAGQQQRVVHPETEAQQRREVEHEDAHRHHGPDQEDARERDHDSGAADDQRHPGRDRGAEDDQQRDGGKRQRDHLAPSEVRFRHALDVAVERRPAGQLDRQAGCLVEPSAEDRQGLRGVIGRQVEEDDVVGGVPVGRDLPRRQQMRDHARDVRGARDVGDGRGRGAFERGRPGLERRTAEDDDERRRREAELAPEEGLRPSRFEVVEDEAAGRQDARHARRERDGGQQDERPDAHHEPRPTRDEAAEAIEGTHGTSILVARADLGPRTSGSIAAMQLFLVPFTEPVPFGISAAVVILMIGIMLRAAVSSEGGSRWVRRVTNPNGKYLFGFLFVLWALVLRDHAAARAPRGGRIAVRRAGADRPVHRLLHHDGLPLGGHRRLTPVGAPTATRDPDRS